MLFICAPDSFKESMSARAAAEAMERGIRRVHPDAEVLLHPMADGGEGTGAVLAAALGGRTVEVPCHDALGRPAIGRVSFVAERSLAVIEVADACGIEALAPAERDARVTTTRGVGELVRAALDLGATTLLVGLGGSATNDAGAGMLTELGARFLDAAGEELPAGGAALAVLASVDLRGIDPRLASTRVLLACDVDNPLLGDRGASAVFGPQKGADASTVAELDGALARWADAVEAVTGRAVRDRPGAGAAGGLGAAFLACGDARLESGATTVLDLIGFDERLAEATVVFTGEGSLDAQSLAGKVPLRVAERAAAAGVPTVVFAGRVDPEVEAHPPAGVVAVVPIVREVGDLAEALARGPENLERAAAMACRLAVLR